MRLRDVLNLMFVNTATGDMNIKLKEYHSDDKGRIFYDGKLKDLIDYMKTHDNLNQCDGFPVQVHSIYKWEVVEILVDHSRKDEANLPDYNKGKIIIIL